MSHVQITSAAPRVDYTVANTPQTAFAVPFAYFDPTDLVVYVGGLLKVLTTDYTVAGTAVDGGFSSGTVTLNAAASNTTVSILRNTSILRTEDFPYPSSTLNIETLNTALDKITAWAQQLFAKLSRVMGQPDTDVTAIGALPAAASRANMFLAFDSNGNPIVAAGTSANLTPVSTFVNGLLGAASALAFQQLSGGGLVLLNTATANNSAAVAFTGIDGTYDEYLILIDGLLPAASGADLLMKISEDGGNTFIVAGYQYANTVNTVGTGVTTGNSASATNLAIGLLGLDNNTAVPSAAEVWLCRPASGQNKNFRWQAHAHGSGANLNHAIGAGYYNGDQNAYNAIRFEMTSGSITSGNFRLYGVRKS